MVIYKITNTINGKAYVGQTVQSNPRARWYQHKENAKKQKHPLYCAMRKYGVHNFKFEIETGKQYRVLEDAAKDIGTVKGAISKVLRGTKKQIKGFTFKYVKGE